MNLNYTYEFVVKCNSLNVIGLSDNKPVNECIICIPKNLNLYAL